jgi:hypothetical protein
MDVTDKIVLGVLVDDARLYKTPVLYDLQSSPIADLIMVLTRDK